MKWPIAAFGILFVSMLQAQSNTAEFGGYAKYLFSHTEMPTQRETYDHLLHVRMNTKWFPMEDFSGILELRSRLFYGEIVEQTPGFADMLGHDAGFGKLGTVMWNQKKSTAYTEIDRLYLNWGPSGWQISAGRQRIAWGTNLVWNPIDLFNPQSVLDFDYEERPAVDAVRIQYYTGNVSKVELAVKPGTASSEAISAAQWSVNKWDYDFHFLGGWKAGNWFAGTGWAGDIRGGGFRGEVMTSRIAKTFQKPGSAVAMISFAVSGDYTFQNSLYVHTEGLYNSEGVVSDAALSRTKAQTLGLLIPARWSIYQELSFNVSPLVHAGIFAILNPTDRSSVVVPSTTWSVITNFDLTFLALFFSGYALTEYGQLGTALYIRGKWSF
jgi:hypothetical protein